MSDLFRNHIVGFPTRRLISLHFLLFDLQIFSDLASLIQIHGNDICDYLVGFEKML